MIHSDSERELKKTHTYRCSRSFNAFITATPPLKIQLRKCCMLWLTYSFQFKWKQFRHVIFIVSYKMLPCLLLRVDGDTVCNATKAQTQASFVHLEILLFLSIFPSFCYTFLIFFNISISKGMTKRTHCHWWNVANKMQKTQRKVLNEYCSYDGPIP